MNEHSHLKITQKSIELSGIEFTKYQKEVLSKYCTQPDIDENEGAYKYHFYNPSTKMNFRGERTSALTKFIEHYRKSLDYKDEKMVFEHLGRSMHFLEDLCTPVHTYYEDFFDGAYRLKQHMDFEKTCDKLVSIIGEIKLENGTQYYIINDLKTIGNSCAMVASVLFNNLDENIETAEEIGKKAIKNAIQATTGILLKFNNEVDKNGNA